MKDEEYFNLMFNDGTNPSAFSDMESYDLLFMNRAMVKLLNLQEDYQGKKCYEAIYGRKAPCSFCPNFLLEKGKFIENYIFNAVLGKNYRVVNTMFEHGDRNVNLCKYLTMPFYENDQTSFEEAMIEYADIFSTAHENDIFNDLLGLLGRFYQSKHSFIFAIYPDSLQNLNCWAEDNTTQEFIHIHNASVVQTLCEVLETSCDDGMLELTDLRYVFPEQSEEYRMLDQFNIENSLMTPIYHEDGSLVGVLAIINRRKMMCDFRLLKSVTRFVGENFNRHVHY